MNSTAKAGHQDIADLVARSHEHVSVDTLTHITPSLCTEKLVPVEASDMLRISPIWHNPQDDEGRLMWQYIQDSPKHDRLYVRQGLRDRLIITAQALPTQLKLVVHAGYRPLAVQRHILAAFANKYQANHPDISKAEALEHARLFVSDPDIKIPPHCCGAAVDVSLLDATTGQLLDMGSRINQDDEQSYLHAENITMEQQANRMILLTAMLKAGFASYPTEWWHYSYGDPLWAWFYNRQAYLYDLVDEL